MKRILNHLPLLSYCFIVMVTALISCRPLDIENKSTVMQLYKIYSNGEISECQLDGQKVYHAALNAYDAGSSIYDISGVKIGDCNYAWNHVDTICQKLEKCEVIYRVKYNIWGLEAVDKYHLDKHF